ncbi:unnamed protein product [Caenorhabditis auriculariae]|uniref:FXNA-like protease n=1 Tax=Caenorhabditis auriculariae TaxID=2777116 RepID=A0A8S1HGP8_9PELO|nr:unnamed protein product [Caenorhabditis auriculariae]
MEVRRRKDSLMADGKGDIYYQEEVVDFKTRRIPEAIGFRHWLLFIATVGLLYGGVVFLHRKMPPVRDGTSFTDFSETRARFLLKQLTALGPRPSGSENLEVKAFNILNNRISLIKNVVSVKGFNRLETDVQRPSGCFDLKFLSSFTLCYHEITNIAVRIGPSGGPTENSLLLNCHFDTMPDTPGATDDAVSCAIMMDVLEVLAHSHKPLAHDIIFLFNGAEENFLQAAHGFIQQHPWRHSIKAFINLEGTGSGGREILFQAGPGNSWLLQTYLENAPHPFCSVLAQEIFQSGIIPSDTDFRIFRDYGRISGLDIAYTKNGWVYHTEFDEERRIEAGAIQRAGENVLAVVKAILESPYLEQPATFDEGNRWVFYDVVGLFTVYYSVTVGKILNYLAVALTFVMVVSRLEKGLYTRADLAQVFFRHGVAFSAMLLAMFVLIGFVVYTDLVMCWYKMPEIVGMLYVLPLLIVGCIVHTYFADHNAILNVEMLHYDSILISLASILFLMTWFNLASAFYVLNYLLLPACKDLFIYILGSLGVIRKVTPRVLFFSQLFCFVPPFIFAAYAISQCVDFFVPVMGRLGNAINPEFIMGPIGLLIASSFVLFVNNLFYISRRMNYLIRLCLAIFGLFLVMLLTTKLGNPYEYTPEDPRLRRIIALHANRSIYDFDGDVVQRDNALFVHSLDYRGAMDLPAHSFLQGSSPPNCSGVLDEYCRMPYYTAIHELFPPEHSLWVPVPSPVPLPYPIDLKLISRELIGANRLNLTFELRGGFDKMSLHVTPLSGYELSKWSFTDIDIKEFGRRVTYFVFMTYGHQAPEFRSFWILLENHASTVQEPETTHNLEIAVASHHAHGPYQDTDTLRQLRSLIAMRRETPKMAVGWWRWAITMIGGRSEIVVKIF